MPRNVQGSNALYLFFVNWNLLIIRKVEAQNGVVVIEKRNARTLFLIIFQFWWFSAESVVLLPRTLEGKNTQASFKIETVRLEKQKGCSHGWLLNLTRFKAHDSFNPTAMLVRLTQDLSWALEMWEQPQMQVHQNYAHVFQKQKTHKLLFQLLSQSLKFRKW